MRIFIYFLCFFSSIICQTYKISGDLLFKQTVDSIVLIEDDYGGVGSGVIVSYDGHIVTNYHVIEDLDDDEIYVLLYEGIHNFSEMNEDNEYYTVEILEIDKSKDLALLQLQQEVEDISPITFAYDEDFSIGSQVFAIGHPDGTYLWSFTEGIVNRIAVEEWSYSSGGLIGWLLGEDNYQISANIITTQTPINSGNSGGLLMNSKGELIGINTYSVDDLMNVSGAIAVDEVVNFLKKNNIDLDNSIDDSFKENSLNLVYNFQIIDSNKEEGFNFNTIFESKETFVEYVLMKNEQDESYIGIDLTGDYLYDVVLYDKDYDDSFSYWKIDLDDDGEYEWEGNIYSDRKNRKYRKFVDKIEIMLFETFNEIIDSDLMD